MLRSICSSLFQLSGWKFDLNIPENLRSFIFLGAPHTSNYDIIPAMAVAEKLNLNTRFVIKNKWTKFPMGLFTKPAGAIGVDRDKLKGKAVSTTDKMAHLFRAYPELVLMIAPEGTRSPAKNWKTGFYYIAQKAGVPILLGYADYEKKVAGTGHIIYPTDFEKDMKQIMDFYQHISPKIPANFVLDSRFS